MHISYNYKHKNVHTKIQCSSTCRGGIRERQVNCYQNFTDFSSETNFTFDIVDDTLCEILTMPAEVLECNRLIPCPFRWDVSEWQEVRTCTCIHLKCKGLELDVHFVCECMNE